MFTAVGDSWELSALRAKTDGGWASIRALVSSEFLIFPIPESQDFRASMEGREDGEITNNREEDNHPLHHCPPRCQAIASGRSPDSRVGKSSLHPRLPAPWRSDVMRNVDSFTVAGAVPGLFRWVGKNAPASRFIPWAIARGTPEAKKERRLNNMESQVKLPLPRVDTMIGKNDAERMTRRNSSRNRKSG
uniref:Uncharacterized protein n=1 Tax=Candidatus Kentrum sp. TC TaxID=2126339 RepID=A0A450Z095_9GAMM|nr:MAG: hypothetical protein BECKTC1821D_GA0114238_10437 [Candidatus Kentron sp. TC]